MIPIGSDASKGRVRFLQRKLNFAIEHEISLLFFLPLVLTHTILFLIAPAAKPASSNGHAPEPETDCLPG